MRASLRSTTESAARRLDSVDALKLQDWVTLQAASVITQSADSWQDVGEYDDLVFFLEVKQSLNAPTLYYETSATAEDACFLATCTPFTPAIGLRTDLALATYSPAPPAKYVRWRLVNTSGTWQLTFRIWIAAYCSYGATSWSSPADITANWPQGSWTNVGT